MTQLLISVTSPQEALAALAAGADVIDGKDVHRGALGALDPNTLRAIVEAVAGRAPVSAAVGDWPAEPDVLQRAVEQTSTTGVDWIKIALHPGGDWDACLAALAPLARRQRLVGMLLADQTPQPDRHVAAFAAAGFAGVMLDTAGKRGGSLLEHMDNPSLQAFVQAAARAGLSCGLAGSLRQNDIDRLAQSSLLPDVLGFRGAACQDGERTAALEAVRVTALARALACAKAYS